MSRVGEFVTEKLDSIKAAIHDLEQHAKALLGHEDPKVKAIGEDVVKTVDSLKADAGHLESVAVGDAEQVAQNAEVAVKPVVAEAVHDVETVAGQAAADATKAV